jgi:hypothetical protein
MVRRGCTPADSKIRGRPGGDRELSLRSSGREANGRDEPGHRTTQRMKSCYRGGLSSLLSASGSRHPSVKSNDCWNRMPSAVEPPAGTVPSI